MNFYQCIHINSFLLPVSNCLSSIFGQCGVKASNDVKCLRRILCLDFGPAEKRYNLVIIFLR